MTTVSRRKITKVITVNGSGKKKIKNMIMLLHSTCLMKEVKNKERRKERKKERLKARKKD